MISSLYQFIDVLLEDVCSQSSIVSFEVDLSNVVNNQTEFSAGFSPSNNLVKCYFSDVSAWKVVNKEDFGWLDTHNCLVVLRILIEVYPTSYKMSHVVLSLPYDRQNLFSGFQSLFSFQLVKLIENFLDYLHLGVLWVVSLAYESTIEASGYELLYVDSGRIVVLQLWIQLQSTNSNVFIFSKEIEIF